jgi:hypothetical protein
MLTVTVQSQMAEATAQMMRACVLAATRPWTDSALRGLALWSEIMLAAGERAPAAQDTTARSYASYRSGGGHAAAQVIVPGRDDPPARSNALAALVPMYDMLDAWRAAFGTGQRN